LFFQIKQVSPGGGKIRRITLFSENFVTYLEEIHLVLMKCIRNFWEPPSERVRQIPLNSVDKLIQWSDQDRNRTQQEKYRSPRPNVQIKFSKFSEESCTDL